MGPSTISRSVSWVMITLALMAAGLAYGHSRLSLAQAYRIGRDHDLAELHLQASRPLGDLDARWQYLQARVLLVAAESGLANHQQLRNRAQTHLRAALGMSPLWSDAWTWLAITQLQQANTDANFDLALARSIALGPNEIRNLVALFPWVLLHWADLSESQQSQILLWSDRAARWIPSWLVSTASRYSQLYTVCDRLETRIWAVNQCQQMGWTASRAE